MYGGIGYNMQEKLIELKSFLHLGSGCFVAYHNLECLVGGYFVYSKNRGYF